MCGPEILADGDLRHNRRQKFVYCIDKLGFRVNLPQANPPVVRATSRSPGRPNELPTQADVDDCLSRTEWADFNDALENIPEPVDPTDLQASLGHPAR